MDEWKDGWMDNVKTVYPSQTQFADGIIMVNNYGHVGMVN